MSFGRTADARRAAAKKHANRYHTCPYCGRVIRGNAFYRHKQVCWAKDKQVMR
jgi:hypothetical protein